MTKFLFATAITFSAFTSFAHATSVSGCQVGTVSATQSKLDPKGTVRWSSKSRAFFQLNCRSGGEVKFATDSATGIPLLLLAKQTGRDVTVDFQNDESTGLTEFLNVLMP